MKNKIIILGGSGFLASHLTDLFEKNKVKSLILDKIKKIFLANILNLFMEISWIKKNY